MFDVDVDDDDGDDIRCRIGSDARAQSALFGTFWDLSGGRGEVSKLSSNLHTLVSKFSYGS